MNWLNLRLQLDTVPSLGFTGWFHVALATWEHSSSLTAGHRALVIEGDISHLVGIITMVVPHPTAPTAPPKSLLVTTLPGMVLGHLFGDLTPPNLKFSLVYGAHEQEEASYINATGRKARWDLSRTSIMLLPANMLMAIYLGF